jgi:hypothetical protein
LKLEILRLGVDPPRVAMNRTTTYNNVQNQNFAPGFSLLTNPKGETADEGPGFRTNMLSYPIK